MNHESCATQPFCAVIRSGPELEDNSLNHARSIKRVDRAIRNELSTPGR
jgi:hypothetical protein